MTLCCLKCAKEAGVVAYRRAQPISRKFWRIYDSVDADMENMVSYNEEMAKPVIEVR